MKITLDTVVQSYVETRAKIKELEDQISELKAFQAKKEEYLNQQMTLMGVENVKTAHGTAYSTVAESVTVADQGAFFDWVQRTGSWECIEKRAAKTAILQIMGDDEGNGRPNPLPPGLNYTAIKKINIRKS